MKFNQTLLSLLSIMFAAASVLVVPTTVVHAEDEIVQENVDTGNNSVNKNKTAVNRVKETLKKTKAKVKNAVAAVANTGGNVSKFNTTGGAVNSGDVVGAVGLTNDVNQNVADCCCGEEGVTTVDVDQTNDTTGNHSTNRNTAVVNDVQSCKNITTAKVKNDVSLVGNTGGNKAIGNTTSGNVGSGDVTFGVSIGNTVN
jgi:hypothetical protein